MSKEHTTKKSNKKESSKLKGVLGMLMLFVCASITYSTYVIIQGTDGWTPMIMVTPQAIFAALILTERFVTR